MVSGGASVLGIIKKLSEAGIPSPTEKETWSKRSIEKILESEKYTGMVTLLDSATQEYKYQMKECHPPIITQSEFRAVQEEKSKRSNIVTDDSGTHRRNIVQRRNNQFYFQEEAVCLTHIRLLMKKHGQERCIAWSLGIV